MTSELIAELEHWAWAIEAKPRSETGKRADLLRRAIDELSRRPQEVGDREQIAGAVERIRATASEARQLAASLDAKPAIAKEIDPGIQRSAYLMAAKHDWLMDAVKEIEAAISTRAPSVGEGWRPIETAPRDGTPFLATTRVYDHSSGKFSHHDTHIVWADDETGEIANEAEQGWRLEDYEFWRPLPAPPSASQPRPEGEMREGWRPIETAPKNATDVLVRWPAKSGWPKERLFVAHWAHGGGDDQPPYGPAWFWWDGYGYREMDPAPTHWMPLPAFASLSPVDGGPQLHKGERR